MTSKTLNVNAAHYPNLDSIAVIGSNSIEVSRKDGAKFRVYAAEYVRGGDINPFTTVCDELIQISLNPEDTRIFQVWTQTNIAPAYGNTVEECILASLPFLNNLLLGRNTGPHKRP